MSAESRQAELSGRFENLRTAVLPALSKYYEALYCTKDGELPTSPQAYGDRLIDAFAAVEAAHTALIGLGDEFKESTNG